MPPTLHVCVIALAIVVLLCSTAAAQNAPSPGKYFAITVVDDETDRGVPLVQLSTTGRISHYTDSNGIVAFYEPGLMNTDVHFLVKSHGYEYPKDNFGYAGVTLKTVEGGSAQIRIKRVNIAERLYRVTGQGFYADTVLLGRKAPISQPVINGLVIGQDSVLTTIYKGKLFWMWGDTTRPSYPLGNFHSSAATSLLPGRGGLDPEVGVDLTYFVDQTGFCKGMAPLAKSGPIWLGALLTMTDDGGKERLFARYINVDGTMKTLAAGIAEFDDNAQVFSAVRELDLNAPISPEGGPFRVIDNGTRYVHFLPLTRTKDDTAHLLDPSSYEAFTCAKPGSRLDKLEIDRAADGKVRWDWKRDAPALKPNDEAKAIENGLLKPEDALFHIQDCDTGQPVGYHSGSVYWNAYRHRWVMVMLQLFGTSVLGEVWYLEADTPLGPWVYARKIVTHDKCSFYNPVQHPEFDKDSGREIFFEGTYAAWMSGNSDCPTPRYDYNQIMYKLDLSSPRLALPVPIYAIPNDGIPDRFAPLQLVPDRKQNPRIAFFAPDLSGVGTVPVYSKNGALVVGDSPGAKPEHPEPVEGHEPGEGGPIFYALPAGATNPPATTTPLYEFLRDSDGRHAYSTDASWSAKGFHRSERPLCLVWKDPMTVSIPIGRYTADPGSKTQQ